MCKYLPTNFAYLLIAFIVKVSVKFDLNISQQNWPYTYPRKVPIIDLG